MDPPAGTGRSFFEYEKVVDASDSISCTVRGELSGLLLFMLLKNVADGLAEAAIRYGPLATLPSLRASPSAGNDADDKDEDEEGGERGALAARHSSAAAARTASGCSSTTRDFLDFDTCSSYTQPQR